MKTPLLALLFLPLAAHGTVVTTPADKDNGTLGGGSGISLREAVKYSQVADTITFAPSLSGQTIRLALGPLQIFKSLTIDASSLPDGLTLSADRTGNGKTADDTFVLLCGVGDLLLDSLTLTGANCGESSGCIEIYDKAQVALTLDHCTLTGNYGYHGAALYARAYSAGSSITIRNSTFSQNTATKGAAGINSAGFALTIQNSTFTANTGGALYFTKGTLSINHTTLTGNTGSFYSGINVASHTANNITLQNSICAGNTVANMNTFTFTGTNNLLTGAPRLAPLGNYGGPTHTMPPIPGSPAQSGIPTTAADVAASPSDQRGLPRSIDSYHIGAVHYQGDSAELRRFWNLDFDGDGRPYGIETGIGTDPLLSDANSPRNLTVSAPGRDGHVVLRFGASTQYFDFSKWVLKRSSTLSPRSFREIYRFTSISSVAQPGITYLRDTTSHTVTDTTAPRGGAFYRLEAINP